LEAKLYDKVNTTIQAVNMLVADNPKVRSGKQKNYYLKNYFKIRSSIYEIFHIQLHKKTVMVNVVVIFFSQFDSHSTQQNFNNYCSLYNIHHNNVKQKILDMV